MDSAPVTDTPIADGPIRVPAAVKGSLSRRMILIAAVWIGVLLSGGVIGSTSLSTAEIYDPVANVFSAIAPMNRTHAGHAAVLLPNGTALVGGWSPPTTEIYDPATDSWQDLGFLPSSSGDLIGLNDGRVLAVGGCYICSCLGCCERFHKFCKNLVHSRRKTAVCLLFHNRSWR